MRLIDSWQQQNCAEEESNVYMLPQNGGVTNVHFEEGFPSGDKYEEKRQKIYGNSGFFNFRKQSP